MALARSRPDWCRHGLRGLLSGEPLRTVTTAPSRGAKYPPFGAVWSSCDLSAKAAQMRSFWCATESGECAPGRKIVRPVTGWGRAGGVTGRAAKGSRVGWADVPEQMRAEIVSRVFHPVPDDQRKLLTVSRHDIRGRTGLRDRQPLTARKA
jgi:hypothetical protein